MAGGNTMNITNFLKKLEDTLDKSPRSQECVNIKFMDEDGVLYDTVDFILDDEATVVIELTG